MKVTNNDAGYDGHANGDGKPKKKKKKRPLSKDKKRAYKGICAMYAALEQYKEEVQPLVAEALLALQKRKPDLRKARAALRKALMRIKEIEGEDESAPAESPLAFQPPQPANPKRPACAAAPVTKA